LPHCGHGGTALKRVGIIFHPLNESAGNLATELEKLLRVRGLSVWLCSAWEAQAAREQVEHTDIVFTVGGDGTILRAAQAVIPRQTPITGINLGNLGFMTELTVDEVDERLPALLAGEGWIDERTLLETEVPVPNAPARTLYALNDVVITHGGVARLIRVEASIDGEALTTYKADGVIVATATGSTGYALAAGGPILHPRAKEMLLLPIVPHLSASFKLVLPAESVITLRVRALHPAMLTVDGHIGLSLASGAEVTVKRSRNTVRFLRAHAERPYYGSLERRLKGKERGEPGRESHHR
jgi:NAD+ kinase